MVLAAHAGPPWALELPSQVDLLSLPAPMPMVRCRLALALRMATLRRWLRDPPLAASRSLLVDSLTGLYNHGAFLDYLRMPGEEWALIGLEHDRLEWINRQAGYAAGNLVLAALGRSLRRRDPGARLRGASRRRPLRRGGHGGRPVQAGASARPPASDHRRGSALADPGGGGSAARARHAAADACPGCSPTCAACGPPRDGSGHVLTAIGGQRRAGDEAGIVAGEEDDAAGDLLGLAEAADGDQRQDPLVQHLLVDRPHHLGADIARADRS